MKTRLLGVALAAGTGIGTAQADQQILDDLIVGSSLCVGQDCANGESFGFDTIRLKENNVRIKFQDTSNSASFPSTDWQLTANDSTNGGANKFSIDDISGGRTPFTIEGSAPNNSLYVDDGGRIGLGTNSPTVELHVVDGDSPTFRLEQDGSSGFTAQTWDLAGNETNFFVRDATTGSRLPFRIRAGASNNAFYIGNDDRIGLGTASPSASLHLRRTDGTAELRIEEASSTTAPRFVAQLFNNGAAAVQMGDTSGGQAFWAFQSEAGVNPEDAVFKLTNSVGLGDEFILQTDGDLFITGTLTESSDRNAKMAIVPVDPAEILAKVTALPVALWTYKDDTSGARHLGPMAQDFHALFGLGATETGISTLDSSGVALAAIKALAEENARLVARIEMLEAAIAR